MDAMAAASSLQASSPSASPSAVPISSHAHGIPYLDELLLGTNDLEAMPFEFGCDFATAFEDKQVEVDAPAPLHNTTQRSAALAQHPSEPCARELKSSRSHKRKNDALSSSSSPVRAPAPGMLSPVTLNKDSDDLSSLDPKSGSTQVGRWTKKEHELFLEGLRLYGKSWKKISSLVVTRTLVQIRTHAQKYLQKQSKSAIKAAAAAAADKASSAQAKAQTTVSHLASILEEETLSASWKAHSTHSSLSHSSLFHPIAFPGHCSVSSSLSSSCSSSSSSFSLRKDLPQLSNSITPSHTMSKLDQLLHDESHNTTGGDDYYSSPTGTDDDLVQWLQHRHLPLHTPLAKRRRIDLSSVDRWNIVNPMEAMASSASHQSVFCVQGSEHSHSHSSHHMQTMTADFLPSLASFTTAATSNTENDFTFGSSWM